MKPLKMTMTAFGPYKDKEVIDFSELNEHRLFVVSGNTGAGKTSIFDGICFALYGEASGEDRNDARMLRSHFADDDVHTSVDFEFELKGRVYRVFRQLAHVKAGNKNATGDKYELYERANGQEFPLADRFIVSQVNEKIQQILGLTKDQFSQIVMLPQGEFRKLLTSETENKEEILRKIFKTNLYKYVTELLNEKRRHAQRNYDEQVSIRTFHLDSVKSSLSLREGSELHSVFGQQHYNTHQVMEALANEISYLEDQMIQQKQTLDTQSALSQEMTKAYHRAEVVNNQFDSLDEKRNKKEQLEQMGHEYTEKAKQVSLAEKAESLKVYEQHYTDMKGELNVKQKSLQDAEQELSTAEEALKAAKTVYEQEESKGELRERTVLELERLNGFLPTVKESDQKQQSIQKLESEVETLQNQRKKVETELEAGKTERTTHSNKIKELEAKLRSFSDQSEKLSGLREQAKLVKEYISFIDKEETDKENESQQREAYEKTEKEYAMLEALWIEGQAGILASHLHDGQPCPVCGGVDHPKKAAITNEIPTKEKLEQKRKEKTDQEKKYLTLKAALDVTVQQLQEKQVQVLEQGFQLETIKLQYDQLVESGKALAKEVDELKNHHEQLDQLKELLETADGMIERKQIQKEEIISNLNEKKTAFSTEKALYDQGIASIPEEIRSLEKLAQRIQTTAEQKKHLEAEWSVAQKQFQESNESHIKAQSGLTNTESQLNEAQFKLEKAHISFTQALHGAGFETEAEYHEAKMNEAARQLLKNEIEEYHASLATIRKQIEELEAILREKERKDLEDMKAEVEQLNQNIESTSSVLHQVEADHKKGLEGKENILQAEEKVMKAEQQFHLFKDLYDVVRGDNIKKISFERYLQIEFLEKIIHAANLRLQRLTNGQFYLVRSDRLEKRGKQSGLGLDVYDNYTGQMRDVKTLSGGEKFNASLCLALGMSDVIQSYEGGISLETMFIDEGFGSLDEESLNKAIDTLIDLQQSGRMIGIISHVQELKQAIPAILEVKKTKEGYSYTQFLVS